MLAVAEREGAGGTVSYDFQRRTANTVKAAEIAGVTVRTIYNWMRLGSVEYIRTPGRGVRIYVDTLFRRVED